MTAGLIRGILCSENHPSPLTVKGWVRTRRISKNCAFLEINDGSCLSNLQCVVDRDTDAWLAIEEADTGAAVSVTGTVQPSLGKGQKWEMLASMLEILGKAAPETYPLQKKRHSDEFLRGIAHLRPRTNKYGSVFRVRSEAAFAIHDFFRAKGFYYVHTPIITGSDCEGAGEMFRVTTLDPFVPASGQGKTFADDFFGKDAKLTVSGQLEAEALATGLGRVYTFGPTFRAENSNTPRHAAEFWMVEPEMCFADLHDDIELGEALIRNVTGHVLNHCQEELGLFDRFMSPGLLDRLQSIFSREFDKISYADAIEILRKSGQKFQYEAEYGSDLQTEHERFLAEEYFKNPVAVYDYPKDIKAFYMRMNADNKTVAAVDILVPGIGELIGGSQREERLDYLKRRISELGQDPDDYGWYLDLRRYGTVPHSGFGMGFERLVMMLTGISNIRDVLPFPRTPGSLEF